MIKNTLSLSSAPLFNMSDLFLFRRLFSLANNNLQLDEGKATGAEIKVAEAAKGEIEQAVFENDIDANGGASSFVHGRSPNDHLRVLL
jgi:hypothetical protein